MVDIWWNGFGTINSGEKRFHPTQKPVKLYDWILHNYAKPNDLILDTHLGSGTIALACWDMNMNLDAFEINTEYFDKACKQLEDKSRILGLW